MPKYRISVSGNRFYPQWKGWWFWNTFLNSTDTAIVSFANQRDAENYLERIHKDTQENRVIPWEPKA